MSAVPGPARPSLRFHVGVAGGSLRFEGFLPAKTGARRAVLEALRTEARTIVCYEAPHRIADALQDCATVLGESRRAVVARELTKKFETVYRGTLAEIAARASNDPDLARGEIVIVIEGQRVASEDPGNEEVDRVLRVLVAELPASQASRIAAQLTGRGRNALYDRAVALRAGGGQKSDAGEADRPTIRRSGGQRFLVRASIRHFTATTKQLEVMVWFPPALSRALKV